MSEWSSRRLRTYIFHLIFHSYPIRMNLYILWPWVKPTLWTSIFSSSLTVSCCIGQCVCSGTSRLLLWGESWCLLLRTYKFIILVWRALSIHSIADHRAGGRGQLRGWRLCPTSGAERWCATAVGSAPSRCSPTYRDQWVLHRSSALLSSFTSRLLFSPIYIIF